MELWHEMKKYHQGETPEGISRFEVPLPEDEDGMIGRECPNESCATKYFKIRTVVPDEAKKQTGPMSEAELTCPYCGTVEHMQHFHTEAQVEWIKSMMVKDMHRAFQKTLEEAFRPMRQRRRGEPFSITMEYRPGRLPPVRRYIEEKLKTQISCANCGFGYAVYGVSFHCPFCGKGTLAQHVRASAQTIRVLVGEADRIGTEHGQDARDQMLGNALEDIVSLFEGFLKHVHRYSVTRRYPPGEAERRIRRIRNNFQRLAGAEEILEEDLGVRLLSALSSQERVELELGFAKRHVLTHNLGLVDDKYRAQAESWARPGAEVPLDSGAILRLLTTVTGVVESAVATLLERPDGSAQPS